MKAGWRTTTLGELFDITSSKRVFESEWTSEGVPFYRAREIVKLARNGFVENELFISEEMFDQYSTKYGIPQEGDIMVTGVGTLGICYVVQKKDRFYFKDGNIICLEADARPDAKAADVMKVLKRSFSPEFLNRIDETVVFNRLGDEDLRRIVRLLVEDLNITLQKHNLRVELSDDACDHLVKTTARDRAYGARPLRRAIQKQVEDPLAELMVAHETVPSGLVRFHLEENKLVPVFEEAAALETQASQTQLVGAAE